MNQELLQQLAERGISNPDHRGLRKSIDGRGPSILSQLEDKSEVIDSVRRTSSLVNALIEHAEDQIEVQDAMRELHRRVFNELTQRSGNLPVHVVTTLEGEEAHRPSFKDVFEDSDLENRITRHVNHILQTVSTQLQFESGTDYTGVVSLEESARRARFYYELAERVLVGYMFSIGSAIQMRAYFDAILLPE